jgi:hypothetical protein
MPTSWPSRLELKPIFPAKIIITPANSVRGSNSASIYLQPKIEHQQAIFKRQAEAQVKAWREAAENLRTVGKEFAAGRRREIEATLKQMEADAAVAEKKLQKINEAGKQSWSALVTALTETRGAFDRANQAAQEAFKQAV